MRKSQSYKNDDVVVGGLKLFNVQTREYGVKMLINGKQASELLGIPYYTFCYWKKIGISPKRVEVGQKSFYRKEDIMDFQRMISKSASLESKS
ncbi:hypothetical protein MCHI_000299 [Candidatus Magnetoovum chiemensis]|nr:hypothetical protein MCHI_000299 [Candidatus Magnetoovum chiemensis]